MGEIKCADCDEGTLIAELLDIMLVGLIRTAEFVGLVYGISSSFPARSRHTFINFNFVRVDVIEGNFFGKGTKKSINVQLKIIFALRSQFTGRGRWSILCGAVMGGKSCACWMNL